MASILVDIGSSRPIDSSPPPTFNSIFMRIRQHICPTISRDDLNVARARKITQQLDEIGALQKLRFSCDYNGANVGCEDHEKARRQPRQRRMMCTPLWTSSYGCSENGMFTMDDQSVTNTLTLLYSSSSSSTNTLDVDYTTGHTGHHVYYYGQSELLSLY